MIIIRLGGVKKSQKEKKTEWVTMTAYGVVTHLHVMAPMWASGPYHSIANGLVYGDEEGSHPGNIWGKVAERLIATTLI